MYFIAANLWEAMMTGRAYLQNIKNELLAGHYQHKKGELILGAFGYSRRRKVVLSEINRELKRLKLRADPPIDEDMPLDSSHISFFLLEPPRSKVKKMKILLKRMKLRM